jgi:plastocyanin
MFRRPLVLIAAIVLAVAACNSPSPTPAPVTAAPTLAPALITPVPADTAAATGAATQAAGNAASVEVSISGFAFAPASITVAVGGTVTWTNNDNAAHTIAAKDGSFTSPALAQGQSWSHKFTAAGSVDYACSIHPAMQGTVVVAP